MKEVQVVFFFVCAVSFVSSLHRQSTTGNTCILDELVEEFIKIYDFFFF